MDYDLIYECSGVYKKPKDKDSNLMENEYEFQDDAQVLTALLNGEKLFIEGGDGYWYIEDGFVRCSVALPNLHLFHTPPSGIHRYVPKKRVVKVAPALLDRKHNEGRYYLSIDMYSSESEARELLGSSFYKWLGGTNYEIEIEVED